MSDETRQKKAFDAEKEPLILPALILAFFAQPLLPYTHPNWLIIGGVILAYGIWILHHGLGGRYGIRLRIAYGVTAAGMCIILLSFAQAALTADDLDKTCSALQQQMLGTDGLSSGAGTAASPKDVYTALGCRFHGHRSIWDH